MKSQIYAVFAAVHDWQVFFSLGDDMMKSNGNKTRRIDQILCISHLFD